jgi:hypothetical protein
MITKDERYCALVLRQLWRGAIRLLIRSASFLRIALARCDLTVVSLTPRSAAMSVLRQPADDDPRDFPLTRS